MYTKKSGVPKAEIPVAGLPRPFLEVKWTIEFTGCWLRIDKIKFWFWSLVSVCQDPNSFTDRIKAMIVCWPRSGNQATKLFDTCLPIIIILYCTILMYHRDKKFTPWMVQVRSAVFFVQLSHATAWIRLLAAVILPLIFSLRYILRKFHSSASGYNLQIILVPPVPNLPSVLLHQAARKTANESTSIKIQKRADMTPNMPHHRAILTKISLEHKIKT